MLCRRNAPSPLFTEAEGFMEVGVGGECEVEKRKKVFR